jgi:hypothetical protein
VLVGKSKALVINPITGQAGSVQIIPTNSVNAPKAVHVVLGELRVEGEGEVDIEDGVDLEIAGGNNTCYLLVTGVISYKV